MSSTTTGVAYTSPTVEYTHFCCNLGTDSTESCRSPWLKRVPCASWLYIGQSFGSWDTLCRGCQPFSSQAGTCANATVARALAATKYEIRLSDIEFLQKA